MKAEACRSAFGRGWAGCDCRRFKAVSYEPLRFHRWLRDAALPIRASARTPLMHFRDAARPVCSLRSCAKKTEGAIQSRSHAQGPHQPRPIRTSYSIKTRLAAVSRKREAPWALRKHIFRVAGKNAWPLGHNETELRGGVRGHLCSSQ
ncbi:hypothetical protein COCON_G00207520 [Conger conger]|uniref:Uncharacterized protein n=1 Tax=Conger conger TaxID=82655 RepID=A0A9Q1CZE0_CONCO|nr:hypothetical protein COCON_G00207520 [Conger conger]